MGRIEHSELENKQVGSEEIWTAEVAKQDETVHVEMNAGDSLLFYCNTRHRSDQNRSPNKRWTLIFCYNVACNDSYLDHHPHITQLKKVSDDGYS